MREIMSSGELLFMLIVIVDVIIIGIIWENNMEWKKNLEKSMQDQLEEMAEIFGESVKEALDNAEENEENMKAKFVFNNCSVIIGDSASIIKDTEKENQ